ncbi:MAG: flagellar hook-length control protein FliK [Peptostreptococcaceae bacterium]|jgi:flagellar hook-length control protein FliK|nr:flagellar hook-length control protein FliK [Peptostreptococcaceae bacterium]
MNTGFSLLGSISEIFSSRSSNQKPRVDNKDTKDVFKNNFEDKLSSSKKRVEKDKNVDKKDIERFESKEDKKIDKKDLKANKKEIKDDNKYVSKKDIEDNKKDIEDVDSLENMQVAIESDKELNDIVQALEGLNLNQEDIKQVNAIIDQILDSNEGIEKSELMVLVDSLKEFGIDLKSLDIGVDLTNKIENILNTDMNMAVNSLNKSDELDLEIEDLKSLDDAKNLDDLKTVVKNIKEQLNKETNNLEGKEVVAQENLKEVANITNKDMNITNNISNLVKDGIENSMAEFEDLDFEQGDSKEDSTTNLSSSIKFSSNVSKMGNAKVNSNFENMLLKQVTDEIKLNVKKDISTLEMKLEPETLGKVTLRIALEKGALNIKVLAEDDKVKETLENNIEELKSVLEEQGLSVENLEVSVNDDNEFRRHRDILRAMSLNKRNVKNDFTLFDEEELSIEDIKNPYLTDDKFNEFA